jgi:aminoglycoside phosphotransferase (APT) family kinase protein
VVNRDALAGRELLGQGREAEIYAWDDGLVLRLFRTPELQERLERELAAMSAAAACGVPVPQVEGTLTVDGRPGLLLERIDGRDIISLFGRRPWTVPRMVRRVALLQAQMHDAVAPPDLEDLRVRVRRKIGVVSGGVLPKELADYALEQLDTLPDGDRLCHGDFHPGNVLLSSAGPRIIDWTAASRGDPTGDLARTCLMLTVGEAEPTMPMLVRRLDSTGRSVVVRSYLRAYRRLRPIDDELLARWHTVRAADRLAEEITGEQGKLVGIVRDAAEQAD